jgi:hypothetical protein
MEAIGPWVQDCIRLMDSDGGYAHFKYPGSMGEQPFLAMDIFDVIRSKWCEMKNSEMEKKYGNKQAGGNY